MALMSCYFSSSSSFALTCVSQVPGVMPKTNYSTTTSRDIKMVQTLRCLSSHYQKHQASQPTKTIVLPRRSANYPPSVWDYHFIKTLSSDYQFDESAKRKEALEEGMKPMFHGIKALESLELIDDLQRLGIGHFFRKEIKEVLDKISVNDKSIVGTEDEDLHATSLKFRLLRQHGRMISQDVFNSFRDEKGDFKQSIVTDVRGMLSLYEASYLSLPGETIFNEAQAFTKKHLEDFVFTGEAADKSVERLLVEHALEMPLHWRSLRPESRWYIDTYARMPKANPSILNLAKLEFNMVQSLLQEELKDVARWWDKLGIQKKLSFSRDRIVESFLLSMCMVHDSQFRNGRLEVARVIQMISTVDDIFDIYGSWDELKLFAAAVERWDIQAMQLLPDYMKPAYLMLYNAANEAAYYPLNDQGCNAVPYLKKAWADLCNGYLEEAKWYNNKQTPTIHEYIEHSWRTIGTTVVLTNFYFVEQAKSLTKEELFSTDTTANLIRLASLIFRLNDDLSTSKHEMARGDSPKAIQCYMKEKGVSESAAREEIALLVSETWKKLNEACLNCTSFSRHYLDSALNTARAGHYMYQFGDGYGVSCKEMEDQLLDLFTRAL